MKAKLLIAAIITIIASGTTILSSCKKDQFTTAPQLSFKEVNTQVLFPNQLLQFTLEYTDKEGDVQDTFYIDKKTRNCPSSDFKGKFPMPSDLPKQGNTKAEIDLRFFYGIHPDYPVLTGPRCADNDTCVFRFVLQDKAGNHSDTISSPEIVIIKN